MMEVRLIKSSTTLCLRFRNSKGPTFEVPRYIPTYIYIYRDRYVCVCVRMYVYIYIYIYILAISQLDREE